MPQFVHADEAHAAALDAIRRWLNLQPKAIEALLVTDLFGKLRSVVFPAADTSALENELHDACGEWWTGPILQAEALDDTSRKVFTDAHTTAKHDETESRLRILDRHRSRTAWFATSIDPPWKSPSEGPTIVVFYSFKGGMGRSTLLASFAIQRARAGQRVCVADLDLDSPGIGRLLSADTEGLTAQWGVVDLLLEHKMTGLRFSDYWHRCDRVSGDGEIRVMPAGCLDESYADKLGRVDLEESPSSENSSLWHFLKLTRDELKPDWILLDARTGISEPAGQLLSGFAHLHVLLGSVQEQSWLGLDLVLDRLGKERIMENRPQSEVLLVQAMVPVGEAGHLARQIFAGRAEETFEDRYYASEDEDADRFWTVADKQSQDAPHVPWPIDYDPRLASFADISDVADALCEGAHAAIGAQIISRFSSGEQ